MSGMLPLILFVPGLRPKPEPDTHRTELLRCLNAGMARVNPDAAKDFAKNEQSFEVVAWNFPFYHEYHDIELDRGGIEAALRQDSAAEPDRREVDSWKRAIVRLIYKLADFVPFIIPRMASGKVELHLKDFRRYARNIDGIGEATRQLLIKPFVEASCAERPVLIIGHSMGSVIAYDALWQISQDSSNPCKLDALLTLGTPLGQNLIRHRLIGASAEGPRRYPGNIHRWINVSAVGASDGH